MAYGVTTQYDNRLNTLRDKLGQKGGPSNKDLRKKIQDVKGNKQSFNAGAGASPAPIPYSSQYESTLGQANLKRDQSLVGQAGERSAIKQSYGFEDASNPFSIARGLERQNAERTAGTQNSYAASGQLYAGSLNTAKASDRFTFEQDLDQAQREYATRLAENSQAGIDTANDFADASLDAKAAALEEALSKAPNPALAPPKKKNKGKGNQGGNQGGQGNQNNQGGNQGNKRGKR